MVLNMEWQQDEMYGNKYLVKLIVVLKLLLHLYGGFHLGIKMMVYLVLLSFILLVVGLLRLWRLIILLGFVGLLGLSVTYRDLYSDYLLDVIYVYAGWYGIYELILFIDIKQ